MGSTPFLYRGVLIERLILQAAIAEQRPLLYNEQKTVGVSDMAEQEYLEIIKQGIDVWNEWRKKHPEVKPDLYSAKLSRANLRDANLSGAKLSRSNLINANLDGADIREADLRDANLRDANLRDANLFDVNLDGANLSGADLRDANLFSASLSGADLRDANLSRSNLRDANLSGANLSGANLDGANLDGANLDGAIMSYTLFGDRDLRLLRGLEAVRHDGPSPLSINSIYLSEGKLPETFVKGTGAPDTFIEYMHALTNSPIEYYTCFISYSSKDQDFAERLYADLQNEGVRCWYAPKELKPGDFYHYRIDESIRVYDKLLLILSDNSVKSEWVEKEVKQAEEKEGQMDMSRQVLFPIRLDDAVMSTRRGWADLLRRSRHIGDFTRWKEHDTYQANFQRLLQDLQATSTKKQ